MKITIGGWFKLPRLGTAVFSGLMKAGVKYDRESGFMLSSDTDIEFSFDSRRMTSAPPSDGRARSSRR